MQSIAWACCGLLIGWAVMAQEDQLTHQQARRVPPATAATLQVSNYQPPARPEFFPGP